MKKKNLVVNIAVWKLVAATYTYCFIHLHSPEDLKTHSYKIYIKRDKL